MMGGTEHWIGVRMAAGYGKQDFIDLANSVAGRPSVERVEMASSAPELTRGAVGAVERVRLLAEWIERDRREPDKVLAYAQELANLATAGGQ